MITLIEAYKKIKACSDFPLTFIMETKDSYWGVPSDYIRVNKETGVITYVDTFLEYIGLVEFHTDKFVDLGDLYADYLNYYKEHTEEASLSALYVQAWNRLFYHKIDEEVRYKSEDDHQRMIKRWGEIERVLYIDIRRIMEKEEIYNPPCVKEKFDDPFYRIKPFMLRNGFTDNDINRTWVRR